MKRYRFQHITAEFIPSFTLGENGVAQRASVESTLVGIVNLEDQLHGLSISNPDHPWLVRCCGHIGSDGGYPVTRQVAGIFF